MFKSKIFNRVLLIGSFIVTLFIIAKLSGVLQYAFVPTAGNEPTIKKKSFIVMTNILPYDKFKMIAYNQNNLDYPQGAYVQRLIGKENDEILIKNGKLFFLGDNRNASLDSRYLGFVDEKDAVGRVVYPKN